MEYGDSVSMRPQHRGPSTTAIISLAIIFGLIAGLGGSVLGVWAIQRGIIKVPVATNYTSGGATSLTQAALPLPKGKVYDFVTIAQAMNESVVNINTRSQQEDPYSFFFGNGPQIVQGLGTGIIVDSKGYILTNFHVVKGANDIKVTVMTADGKKEYKATLVGGDEQEDMALIKIDAQNLKAASLGNSDELRPGEQVMAIGNPFGFEHTVSVGVVSALNRSLPVDDAVTLKGMIQTDASINPGNSGGPLVNNRGEVIGMNSAVFVGRGGGEPQASGIGFAIPSNRAKKIIDLIRAGKKIQHPFIGISYLALNEDIRTQFHIQAKEGLIISRVLDNSPASVAGLKPKDVITSIDGKSLTEENSLKDHIDGLNVGTTVTMSVEQWDPASAQWSKKNVKVKLGDQPDNINQRSGGAPEQQPQQEQPGGRMFPFPPF